MGRTTGRILIISDSLPLRFSREGEAVSIKSGGGGLITALAPVLKDRGGIWIGWDGDPLGEASNKVLIDHSKRLGYHVRPISLSPEEGCINYRRFSHETLWPLFHDFLGYCQFNREHWNGYRHINRKFAHIVATQTRANDLIWVHDYQLLLVGRYLEELGNKTPKSFFLHTPFPPWDVFMRLPWRTEILNALLAYDLIGFQTERDQKSFIRGVRTCFPACGVIGKNLNQIVDHAGKQIRVGSFPISIDYDHFNRLAVSEEVSERVRMIHERFTDRKLILGIDRLDYTKGIPERLESLELLLEKYPQIRGKISLVQIALPSRVHVPEYRLMKENIDRVIGRINGHYTREGWIPIEYIYRTLDRSELVSYYRASQIALITPLKDGMNIVAKEYCASCVENTGVLILSEFAGAAHALGGAALLVNPYNVEEVADRIFDAYQMSQNEQRRRMSQLRREVQRNDIFDWVKGFLSAAGRTDLWAG
jgi:trehalose 6-phosphate synthase